MIAMILALPAGAQQKPVAPSPPGAGSAKPFTQDQVQAMVRDGLGDETGANAIGQRGLDFVPTEDFLQSLKTAGANEAFLQALRAAKRAQPAGEPTKKPLNQVQVVALLAGGVPNHRVAMLVQDCGLDFEPTDDYLKEVRSAGGDDELNGALKSARVTKPQSIDDALHARQAQTRQHTARAAQLARENLYAEAASEYRTALRPDPQNADLRLALGTTLYQGGDRDGAISELREVLRLGHPDPKGNEIAHAMLGVALGAKGDLDGAIAEEREALRLNPDDGNAHAVLGMDLGAKKDFDGEIKEEREALRLNPNNFLAHYNLGLALGSKGDWDGEISEQREALRINPGNFLTHQALGVALGSKGDWDGQIAEEREALRLNPKSDVAHNSLGTGLQGKGNWDGAIAEYRDAVQLNPDNYFAHSNLGEALLWKGDWDGAVKEY
jgi:tetratricopeptide (TPR) repeat protein